MASSHGLTMGPAWSDFLKRSRDGSGSGRGSLKDVFQIVIVGLVLGHANGQEFPGAFQLALHDLVFAARGVFSMPNRSRPTVAASSAKTDAASASKQSTKRRNSDGVNRRESAGAISSRYVSGLHQQRVISSYLFAERPQPVQLLVVDLRTATHASFADLGEPFRAMIEWRVHRASASSAGNSPTPIQGF